MSNSRRIIPGLFIIALGLVLLGMNLEWLHIDIGTLIARFWPLALILPGLHLLIPNAAAYAIVAALLMAAAIWAVSYAPASIRDRLANDNTQPRQQQQIDEVLRDDVDRLKFKLDFGAASVEIRDLTDSNQAYRAEFDNAGAITERISRHNSTLEANLEEASAGHHFWNHLGSRRARLAFTPDVPIELELKSGASKTDLDLSNLLIEQLTLDLGASASDITFGAKAANLTAKIDSGASSLTLRVPRDSGVKIITNSGLTSDNFVEAGLSHADDTFTSSNFDTASHKITIELDTGASSTKLERY